MNLYKS